MMKIQSLALVFALCLPVFATSTNEISTTRLKSTGGAGVGSILMDEATILNPASLSFFNIGAVYFHRGKSDLSRQDSGPLSDGVSGASKEMAIMLSDTKSNVKGSAGYHKFDFYDKERERFVGALAKPVGKNSAAGFGYRYTKETDRVTGARQSYRQAYGGVTHVINAETSVGLAVMDPLKEREEDSEAILGVQYVFRGFVSLLADIGTNFYRDFSPNSFYRIGTQFRILDDFFLRVGHGRDRRDASKTNGAGIAWLQPKLMLEFALASTEGNIGTNIYKNKESSFSLSYRF